MAEVLTTGDGRKLTYEQRGVPDGTPVFFFHGTPGSRIGPLPRSGLLYRLGIRLITYDRPGYGESEANPGRTVASCAADVASIAEELDLKRFAVVGRSGGGPHALACAALLPDNVTRVAAFVSLAPFEAEGLDWFAGMSESNVLEYKTARSGRDPLSSRLTVAAEKIRNNPVHLIASLYSELPKADRRVIRDVGIRRMLEENYAEAMQQLAAGWIDDALAFCNPWGFDVRDIEIPTLLWHGTDDIFSPLSHSLWLADHIPTASMTLKSGAAHFDALDALPNFLPWLICEDQGPGVWGPSPRVRFKRPAGEQAVAHDEVIGMTLTEYGPTRLK
ncbi:alpha/beta fold hydrolase [Streptosporangium sp. G11]|uniref:alpha/beta fold hydrolase n=1 Tax=Streptosporangium sp. G11 TaxID=3436926 RepID=UPI003EBEBCFA